MLHPILKWAQRKDKVFIEIQLRDVTQEKIQLKENSIAFEGISDSKKYEFSFETFSAINTAESKWNKTGFHILLILIKSNQTQAFWPRLTKDAKKSQYIQVDWSKWVDEDQEDEQADKGLGGIDPSQMQGFPGMGGMGDMGGFGGMEEQEEDKQQENIDDLDRPEQVQEKASG